eukprot:7194130-Heterocapsa_arctica.AAC.1
MEDRETITILNAITRVYIRTFGPRKVLTSNQGGTLNSDAGRARASRESFKPDLKPREVHAQLIERQNALLRNALHHTDDQKMRNGLAVPPQA